MSTLANNMLCAICATPLFINKPKEFVKHKYLTKHVLTEQTLKHVLKICTNCYNKNSIKTLTPLKITELLNKDVKAEILKKSGLNK